MADTNIDERTSQIARELRKLDDLTLATFYEEACGWAALNPTAEGMTKTARHLREKRERQLARYRAAEARRDAR
jgi:hypothetical protein